MKGIVDRIEEDIVVCVLEDESVIYINIEDIEGTVEENDVIVEEDGVWKKDEAETKERLEYMKEITKDMWEN
ncbi:MAG: DUF3006 domain-containing protein [Clostridia bacterium]|nr:DUF3006 domain-containing protein [Clostridia bacterium]